MSFKETTLWTCDYCEKQESVKGTSWNKPAGWVHNKLIWNEHHQMNVIFCDICFDSLFPRASITIQPAKGVFKKPFWRRFWKLDEPKQPEGSGI